MAEMFPDADTATATPALARGGARTVNREMTGRRVLVIHPGALGDVLQAVPALRALGREGRVAFCGQPRLGAVLAGGGAVDRALGFDGLGLEMLFATGPVPADLRDRLAAYDRIVSWFGSRDAEYGRRLRALSPDAVVASPIPEPDDAVPVWQHLLETLGPAGRGAPDLAPLVVADAWRAMARRALDEAGARRDLRILLVHPGAGGAWKVPPPELLAAAIARATRTAPAQIVLHVGPADRDAAARVSAALEAPPVALVEPALPALAALCAAADGYLGGDSGVSQLAAAAGAPAVIFYPEATRRQWAPWSATATVVALDRDGPDAAERAGAALAAVISAARRSGP